MRVGLGVEGWEEAREGCRKTGRVGLEGPERENGEGR
jgi:hypothetical protein